MLSRSSFLRESSSACGARGGCARYNGAAAAAPSTPARWRSHFRWPRARTTDSAASAAAGTSSAAAAGRVGARLCASFGACARNQQCARYTRQWTSASELEEAELFDSSLGWLLLANQRACTAPSTARPCASTSAGSRIARGRRVLAALLVRVALARNADRQ